MVTEKLLVSAEAERLAAARDVARQFAAAEDLDNHGALRLDLLIEETLGMINAMAGDFYGRLWLDGDKNACDIHLEATAALNADKKQELLTLSTSGANSSARGLMGRIGGLISSWLYGFGKAVDNTGSAGMYYGMIGAPGIDGVSAVDLLPMWSLDKFKADVKAAGDADAAWDELERSIVANLASNVVVGVRGDKIELVITLDFKRTPQRVRRDRVYTDELTINDPQGQLNDAISLAEAYARYARLDKTGRLRACLLVEETLGMLSSMTDNFVGSMWLEGDAHVCVLHLTALATLNEDNRQRLIAVATSGKNTAPKGFMAKLGRMLANAFDIGGAVDPDLYQDMLSDMDGMTGFINSGMTMPTHAEFGMARYWTLESYRSTLRAHEAETPEARDALDELERSIIARLAENVTVSAYGRRIELTIRAKLDA